MQMSGYIHIAVLWLCIHKPKLIPVANTERRGALVPRARSLKASLIPLARHSEREWKKTSKRIREEEEKKNAPNVTFKFNSFDVRFSSSWIINCSNNFLYFFVHIYNNEKMKNQRQFNYFTVQSVSLSRALYRFKFANSRTRESSDVSYTILQPNVYQA